MPRQAATRMEAMLERVHKSVQWKEFATRNMFENIWMCSADYAKHLAERRVLILEFMRSIGLAPK